MRALFQETPARVTALTLAAALVVAVYLNWQYARAGITPQTEEYTLMVSAEPVEASGDHHRGCTAHRGGSRLRCQ